MARYTFGANVADFVVEASGGGYLKLASADLTFWDAATGGTKLTDLLLNGEPRSSIPVGADGKIPAFEGPDGVLTVWAQAAAGGTRLQLSASAEQVVAAVVVSPVDSVNGYTGAVVLAKGDVGLGAVDNTADVDKPVSGPHRAGLSLVVVETSTGTWTDDAPARAAGDAPCVFYGASDPADPTNGVTTPGNLLPGDVWVPTT